MVVDGTSRTGLESRHAVHGAGVLQRHLGVEREADGQLQTEEEGDLLTRLATWCQGLPPSAGSHPWNPCLVGRRAGDGEQSWAGWPGSEVVT